MNMGHKWGHNSKMHKKPKKEGWFAGRTYRHFDHPLNFKSAQKAVTPKSVKNHAFRPLISYEMSVRRFKGFNKDGSSNVSHKDRLICKAAHKDSQIFAWYAHELENKYATLRKELGIDDCVLAYRSGKGCNIHMANKAFEEVKRRNACSVIAIDISGFFDNIDHKKLKEKWCQVIGNDSLPEDHYKVFKAITRFSRVDQQQCLQALGLEGRDLKKSTKRLCSDKEFHQKICKRNQEEKSLVMLNADGKNEDGSINWRSYGIPQGTPISAVLSNIFMIDFDLKMTAFANEIGGTYWRYSDDILVICPQNLEERAEQYVTELLQAQGKKLKINNTKTEVSRFEITGNNKFICSVRNKDGKWQKGRMQYLGFYFDGVRKMLRHQTIARYQRKMKYAVRNARRTALKFKKDKIRSKGLYRDLTDIGNRSMPAYAKRAGKAMSDENITKQLNSHRKKLTAYIEEQNQILKIQNAKKKKIVWKKNHLEK